MKLATFAPLAAALLFLGSPAAAQPAGKAEGAAALEAGIAKYQAKDLAGALGDFQRAAKLDPSLADAHYNSGVLLFEQGNAAGAAAAFRRTLDVPGVADPMWAAALEGLGLVGTKLLQVEDWGGAAAVLGDAVRRAPDQTSALHNLALALHRQEKWAELQPVAERLRANDPLSENGAVLLHAALRGRYEALPEAEKSGAAGKALAPSLTAAVKAIDSLPVSIGSVYLLPEADGVTLVARVTGGRAAAGTAFTIPFVFHGRNGVLGSAVASFKAPSTGDSSELRVKAPITAPVVGYSYRAP